jgi:DNA-binding transcriptional ArsR family regulator
MSPGRERLEFAVAWYDDRSRTEFVGSYTNPRQFQRDLQMATSRGWFVGDDQPVTTIGAVGPSNDRVTVTFRRSPDWLAAREREMDASLRAAATRTADDKEAALVTAQEALARAEQVFASLSSTPPPTDRLASAAAEQALLAACKDMVVKRRRVLRALDETVREMAPAVALGVSEFAFALSRHQRALETTAARLDSELELLRGQEAVARAAREWQGASDRQQTAADALRKRTAEVEAREAELVERLAARNSALKALPLVEHQAPHPESEA